VPSLASDRACQTLWPIATLCGNAAVRSLSERSGHCIGVRSRSRWGNPRGRPGAPGDRREWVPSAPQTTTRPAGRGCSDHAGHHRLVPPLAERRDRRGKAPACDKSRVETLYAAASFTLATTESASALNPLQQCIVWGLQSIWATPTR
jgi:hypothetical protein